MNNSEQENKAQVIYMGHGGGPLPLLGDASHKKMIDFIIQLPQTLKKPDAILVISAHWKENNPTIQSSPNPAMFYDYYGFPEKAYEIKYPAPGNPELANKIDKLLQANKISSRLDQTRGFDHGLFIPLSLMYPEADIPAIQLSLIQGLNPAEHIALGQALNALMSENILVIGSGFSFHNMRGFFGAANDGTDPANDLFQNWLIETCVSPMLQSERENRLINWQNAPSARYCHPREEHLLPLHVCFGMAGTQAKLIFDDKILGKRNVSFLW
ncbi:MAG: class III extradiol ring-cleavage dioxygenase [Chloroflexota bacterium]